VWETGQSLFVCLHVLFVRLLIPSIHNSLGNDGLHSPTRLFRNHAQLSTFPRSVHVPSLGLPRFNGLSRIYRLQTTNFQSRGENQSAMVKVARYRRSSQDSGCRRLPPCKRKLNANNSYDAVDTLLPISKRPPRPFATLGPTCLDVNHITSVSNDKSLKHGISAVSPSSLLKSGS
jgi:hypothetical protein